MSYFCFMKNLILFFMLFSVPFFGQQNSLKEVAGLFPLYVVDGMVANESQVKLIGSAGIFSVSVYKSDNLPEKLNPFTHFAAEGIIDITLRENTEPQTSSSLERLNIEHQLNELNPVYINRILVKNNAVKIMTEAIIETEIIENNGQKLLNIWTVTPQERNGISKRSGTAKTPQKNRSSLKNVILK